MTIFGVIDSVTLQINNQIESLQKEYGLSNAMIDGILNNVHLNYKQRKAEETAKELEELIVEKNQLVVKTNQLERKLREYEKDFKDVEVDAPDEATEADI